MSTQFFKSGSLALALLLTLGAVQPLFAQHHHHGGHYHGGGSSRSGFGISIGSGGFGLSYGRGYGGYGGSLYGNSYYNSYPSYGYSNYGYGGTSVYFTPQYVTPQYVTPQYVTPVYVTPRDVTSSPVYSTPSVVYRAPRVQSTSRISLPPQDSGLRTNLPGVTFGSRAHIAELAGAVAERTNQLCLALADSYQDNPQFKEVYRDTYSLIARAQQLDSLNAAHDDQGLLASLSDMNAILAQAAPAIESWTPNRGGAASATSHVSSVQSALKLLSIDAGWDASQVTRPAPSSAPTAAPVRVAPAPELLPSATEPTPADPVPAP